jgi:hypothetical protein
MVLNLNDKFMQSLNENQRAEVMKTIKQEADKIAEVQIKMDMQKTVVLPSEAAKMKKDFALESKFFYDDLEKNQNPNEENKAYDFVKFKESIKGRGEAMENYLFESKNISSGQFDKINQKVKFVYKNKKELAEAYIEALKTKVNRTKEQRELIKAVED